MRIEPKGVVSMLARKPAKVIATGFAAAAIAIGGIAIANSSAGNSPAAAAGPTPTAGVIPFDRGHPSQSRIVGQVPQGWNPGSGTIVTGTAADKAKAAAVAAYPGGVVNRVVLLSGGDYNVHMIAVNWPHHVFVSKEFKVTGAE
jgi:hypothetical protein